MASNRIYIQVEFGTDAANQAIVGINKNIKQMGQAANTAGKQAAQGVDSMTLSIQQTSRAFDQLASAFAGLGLARVGVAMVQAADDINRVEIAITAMTGSAKTARDELANIRDIARKSPFAFQDLAEGAQRLQAFGFEASRIPATINAITNAAAALGGSKQKIDSLILAIGQIRVKGVAQGQELFRQLAEQGVDVFPIIKEKLKQQTGRDFSVTDIRKLVEKGRLDGEAIAQAILDGFQKTFASSGENTAKLLSSQFQKLEDDARDLARVLVNEVTPALTTMIGWVRQGVAEFKAWPPVIQEIVLGFAGLASAITVLPIAITLLKALSSGFLLAAAGVGTVLAILKPFGIAMQLAFSARTITGFFALLTPELAALKLMLIGIAEIIIPLAAALVALKAGFELGSKIREALGYGSFASDDAAVNKINAASKSQAVFAANQLRNRLQQTPEYWKQFQGYPTRPYNALSLEELQSEIRDMQGKLAALKSEREARAKQALIDDLELQKHQEEIAQQALEHAQQRNVGGLAALQYKYAGLLRQEYGEPGKDQAYAAGVAKVKQAQAIETEKVIREYNEKTQQMALRGAKAEAQAELAVLERATQERIALIGTETQETALLQAQALQRTLALQTQAANQARTVRLTIATAEYTEQVRLLTEDIKLHGYGQKEINARKKVLEDDYLRDKKAANAQADNEIAQHTLDVQKRVAEETTDLLRQARELEQENRVSRLSQASDIARARLDTGTAQTEQQKAQQVRALEAVEIDSARKIFEARSAYDDREFNDRLAAITLLHDAGLIKEKEFQEANAALVKYYGDKTAALTEQYVHDDEMLRLAAAKRENELAIAERKKVFEGFRDVTSKIFDALLSKSQSVWSAIGNALKTAIIGAIRDIVTSRAAAALMGMFGYGDVAFAGGPRGYGGAPVFATGAYSGRAAAGGGGGILGWLLGASGALTGAQPVAAAGAASSGGGSVTTTTGGATVRTSGSDNRYMEGADGGENDLITEQLRGLPITRARGPMDWAFEQAKKTPGGLQQLKNAFNIGKNIKLSNGTSILWSNATPRMKLGAIFSSSGFQQLAAGVGVTAALAGLQRGGVLGNIMTVGGFALAGSQLGHFLGMPGPAGALLGAGVGLVASGVQRGGAVGLGMDVAGGALAGSMIGGRFAGGPGFVVGAIVGGVIGAGIGVARLFIKTADEKLRATLKQVYGVDVADAGIRKQILEIAKQKYGGNLDVAVRSAEVQDIVRLYSMATGANAKLPRQMYGATFEQSGVGGAQLQTVYSNGKAVANPYTGVTTQQWNTGGLYLQVNPVAANALFEGRVVQVIGNNPVAVGDANTQAAQAGVNRNAQKAAFLEPSTVMR